MGPLDMPPRTRRAGNKHFDTTAGRLDEREKYPRESLWHVKRQLLDVLACPVCRHHPLELKETRSEGEDVEEGTLTCPQCGSAYPIIGSIPDMLPPQDR
jgi:uncharacterized protein YbaR (Trm112 family)